MRIYNNGNYIELLKNGVIKISSIEYPLNVGEENLYDKLLLFATSKDGIDYDDIPSSLKRELNGRFEKIWNSLERTDEKEISSVLTINKLRDFGYKEEDYERIKNASSLLKKSLSKIGLTKFSDIYENYKNQITKKEVQISRFVNVYAKKSEYNENEFKKDIIENFGFSEREATNKYNEMLFIAKELKREKDEQDNYKAALKFAKEFKRRGLSDYEFFKTVLGSGTEQVKGFGLGIDEIHTLYSRDEQYLVDFFTGLSRTNDRPDAKRIEIFVANYKNGNLNDFPFFQKTCNDYGMSDLSDILRLYNDKIDPDFITSEKDSAIYSAMKMEIMDLQQSIIELAIDEGLEIPAALPRVVAPTVNYDSEKVNPQKILLIDAFDFSSSKVVCKSDIFKDDVIAENYREELNNAISADMKFLNIDVDKNRSITNKMLLINGGFIFDEMVKWASYDAVWDNLDPQRAMGVAVNGLSHCNKLVECGILKSKNNKDFEFTSPRCREILMENQNAGYGKLAEIVIKEFEIVEQSSQRTLNQEQFDLQKKEFMQFLDTQFYSYYAPFGKTADEFLNDVAGEGVLTEELHAFNTLYPELKRGVDYGSFVKEYIESKRNEFEENAQSVSSRNTLHDLIIEDESLKILEKLDEDAVKIYEKFEKFPFEYGQSLDEKFQMILCEAEEKLTEEFAALCANNQDFRALINLRYPPEYTLKEDFDSSAHNVNKSIFLSGVEMLLSEDNKPIQQTNLLTDMVMPSQEPFDLNVKRESENLFSDQAKILELDSRIKDSQIKRNELSKDTESDDFRKTQEEFMNLQAVKRKGVYSESLKEFSVKAVEKQQLTPEDAQKFIWNTLENAKKLVNAGILKTSDNIDFEFVDEKAREILYINFNQGIDAIKAENIKAYNVAKVDLGEFVSCYSKDLHGEGVKKILDKDVQVEHIEQK